MRPLLSFFLLSISLALTSAAGADQAVPTAKQVWDLQIGQHARQLPIAEFGDFACGTAGGPPSLPIGDWREYAKCRPDPRTGYHEVYFRYDDEAEYVARAQFQDAQTIEPSTSAFGVPVIVSALFDDDGFLVGFRLVTDPRVDVGQRALGSNMSAPLMARYGEDKFVCIDLPRLDGESEFQGIYLKRQCRLKGADGGLDLFMEAHQFRKLGQAAVDRDGATHGQFESTTFFEAILAGGIPDRAKRLASLPPVQPSERDILIRRARDCPGCDLHGANLKRADLTGANLAGADLTDADLHGAILSGANLTGARLANANVNRADLRRAKLAGAVMDGAMLYASRMDGAGLSGASLASVMAGTAQFAGADLSGANIAGADLRQARLNDADFRAADLTEAALDDAQMTRSNLSGAKLVGASMLRANLASANLSEVDAHNADLFGASLRDADLTSADFSHSRMTSVNLRSAKIDGAKFSGAQLPAGFVSPTTAAGH